MTEIHGAEFLLDRYTTLGNPETLVKNGIQYTIQRYQGKHKNEYLLRSGTGSVNLYENNVLKQQWKEVTEGVKSDEFIRYKNGRVDFRQRFQDVTQQTNFYKIFNHRKGLRMEIWSAKTIHLMYHGESNEKYQREGWGIEYDEESGNMVVEGIWSKGLLKEVIRLFNGDTMTELKRNGEDSLDPVKRIPIYVGGYRYDEDNETFAREGKGCLIDEKSGIAIRESEWKDGKEVSGVNLNDGWYGLQGVHKPLFLPDLKLTVNKTEDLYNLSLQVTDLTISSNCCNDMGILDLNRFKWLRSIEIGNDCFGSVQTFQIDGLNQLKTIKIGKNSFTQNKNSYGNDSSKSFHILNCESLESIEIGQYSFSDFAGEFELKNLPQLQSLQIGNEQNDSKNFAYSSLVLRGKFVFEVQYSRSSESHMYCYRP